MELRLKSLGYRLMGVLWAKPVGTHIFTYNVDTKEWRNNFTGVNGELCIWYNHVFTKEYLDEFIPAICALEAYTNISSGKFKTWEFNTIEERLNELL